jgi:hypothetical protein
VLPRAAFGGLPLAYGIGSKADCVSVLLSLVTTAPT